MDQDKKFKCEKCGKAFKFKSIFLLHSMKCEEIILEEKEDPSKDEKFAESSRQKMKGREYSVITDDDSSAKYQCKRCEKKYNTRQLILEHHYNIHKEMKFKCEKCDKPFPFKSRWKSHIEKCDYMKKPIEIGDSGRQKMKHREYTVIIDDDSNKRFQCRRCKKNCDTRQLILEHHYHIHREKKNKCERCGKCFLFKSHLRRHMGKCNGKNIAYKIIAGANSQNFYQCMICDKKFNHEGGFHQHYKLIHRQKKFECIQCGRFFPHKFILKRHIEKCDGMKEPVQRQQMKNKEYTVIIDNDSSTKYQCRRCEKKYNTRQHILVHHHHVHKEMKLKCEKCNNLFPFKSILTSLKWLSDHKRSLACDFSLV